MRTIADKIEGDLTVEGELCLTGMVTGHTRVTTGAILELRGLCCSDLTVEAGSTAFVRGTVNGSIHNEGGRLEVYGIVQGDITGSLSSTSVDDNAIVNGSVNLADGEPDSD